MKLYLNKFLYIFCFFFISFINTANADNFNVEYKVSTSGFKIGYFNWSLDINNGEYKSEITLKNSGIFSALYKFNGNYFSRGIIENNMFKTQEYRQVWKTKDKIKIVNMLIDEYLIDLTQEPIEKEFARVSLEELYLYFDPITSFINILNGRNEAKTVDGRRIYTLKKNIYENKKIILQIVGYKNIWADHKRNDLKKIEFFIEDGLLPYKIFIYFKERIFKLEKI